MSEEQEHAEISQKLDDILAILNGNGKTGLCAKVNILWGSFIFLLGTVAIQGFILTRILLS